MGDYTFRDLLVDLRHFWRTHGDQPAVVASCSTALNDQLLDGPRMDAALEAIGQYDGQTVLDEPALQPYQDLRDAILEILYHHTEASADGHFDNLLDLKTSPVEGS